jgi:hypothetical protein
LKSPTSSSQVAAAAAQEVQATSYRVAVAAPEVTVPQCLAKTLVVEHLLKAFLLLHLEPTTP